MESIKTISPPRDRIMNVTFLLLCLSLLDAIFTDLGLRFGYIEEANQFVKYIYESSILIFYVIKLGLPLLLLYLTAIVNTRIYLRALLSLTLLLYVAVISLHFFWMLAVTIY